MIETIQLRRDTAANWASVNPVLAESEVGTETDTGKAKLGDGATAWASLPYWNPSGTGGGSGAVSSVFGRTGAVAATSGDYAVTQVTGAAPLVSPALSGTPTAPSASALTGSTQVATTAYADSAVAAETSRAEAAESLLQPLALTQLAVSANTTMTSGHQLYLINATANLTMTLPSPSTVTGIPFWLKRDDNTTSVVTIAPNASELIEGASFGYLPNSLSAAVYVSDGTNWRTL